VAFQNPAHQIKNRFLVKAIVGVEAIVGSPILLLPVLSAHQSGDGAPAKAHQGREHMSAGALERLLGAESAAALLDLLFQCL
jgi:hypothetical protein